MALKWSIVVPVPYSNGPYTSPGQNSINTPVAVYASPVVNFDTQALALDYFVANIATLLNYYAFNIPTRVTYPNPFGAAQVQVLSSYGGYYAQYSHSITLQLYTCTLFTTNFPDGFPMLVYLYQAPEESAPPSPPADITIQLKRDNTIGRYSVKPSDAAALPKYYDPVTKIRAKFDTTRVAIIEETLGGGFMIYEEVALAAISPVYIYNGNRRLIEITTAALIGQYRAV